jgi:WD40 repeat protein
VRVWATDNADNTLKLDIRPITGRVYDISWSFDNQRLCVVGEGKDKFSHVFMWDAGAAMGELSGHQANLLGCDWKPSRPFRIVTASEDTTSNFYEGPPFKFTKANRVHSKFLNAVKYAPLNPATPDAKDGVYVTVSGDGKIVLYEGKTGEVKEEFPMEHAGSIYDVSWNADGSKFATCSADKTVKIWELASKQCVQSIKIGTDVSDMQMGVVWMSGNTVVSLSLCGDMHVIDAAEGRVVRVIRGHQTLVTALGVTANGAGFVTGGSDGIVNEWELGVGCVRQHDRKTHKNTVVGVAVRGSSVYTIAMDGYLRDGDRSCEISGTPQGLARGNCDSSLAVVALHAGVVVVKDMQEVCRLDVPYEPSCVSISADDRLVVVGAKKDNRVYVYALDAQSGSLQQVRTFDRHRGALTSVAFAPQGTQVASGDSNREVCLWDAETGAVLVEGAWVFHTGRVGSVAWSPNGKYVASGSLDRTIIVWNVEKKSLAAQIANCHVDGVNVVAWIDDTTIVSGGADAAVKTWTVSL